MCSSVLWDVRPDAYRNGGLASAMAFTASWHTLLEECDALTEDALLVTPPTTKQFRITDSQELESHS